MLRGYGTAVQVEIDSNAHLMFEPNINERLRKMNLSFQGIMPASNAEGLPRHKVHLITTDSMPQQSDSNFIVRFGSTVSARSVRRLQGIHGNERDHWWGEVRQEINKSAQALNCTHVLGYREMVTVHQYVCIFQAVGTAVRVQDIS